MSKSAIGAYVKYCNHAGWFTADIYKVGTANVVRANGPVTPENIVRNDMGCITHELRDFPVAGFWRPDLGVFVVPESQVIRIRHASRAPCDSSDKKHDTMEFSETSRGYRARDRWARAYDDLNGAPEGDGDR